jgi:hypothetical protein
LKARSLAEGDDEINPESVRADALAIPAPADALAMPARAVRHSSAMRGAAAHAEHGAC